MNNRYIDFVPTKKEGEVSVKVARPKTAVKSKTVVKSRTVAKTSAKPVAKPQVTRATKVTKVTKPQVAAQPRVAKPVRRRIIRAARPAKSIEAEKIIETVVETPVIEENSGLKMPALGVVEDLTAHFVRTDVPKRPLSEKPDISAKAAKAKKVKATGVRGAKTKTTKKAAESEAAKIEAAKKKATSKTYKTPKSPFINQNKVMKRPLSGNVYRKEVVVPKEEAKGPITIIEKPEKERHIGVVITIILTIILGAAAGTVAFLLLPK